MQQAIIELTVFIGDANIVSVCFDYGKKKNEVTIHLIFHIPQSEGYILYILKNSYVQPKALERNNTLLNDMIITS